MSMQTYRLTPKAPLVFRTGKPFLAGTRDRAHYPWPSAWAGMLRTHYMDHHGMGPESAEALLQLPAHGALLAACSMDGRLSLWLPKPADAIALAGTEANGADAQEVSFLRLTPISAPAGTGSDLPTGLLPVGLPGKEKGKPRSSPAFWPLADYLDWAEGKPVAVALSGRRLANTLTLPEEETRTHVSVDPQTEAAVEGRLFQTAALDFAPRPKLGAGWVFVGRGPAGLPSGLVTFGGERRLSVLEPADDGIFAVPSALQEPLSKARGMAVTLATPAVFSAGWRPGWLEQNLTGQWPDSPLRVRLRAAVVERWQPVSGWDLRARAPKPMRRAVAAGATYWFEVLDGDIDPARLWLQPISDAAQDRRDGFGLAVLRPWTPLS
ncbi:MAG: CRISPR-associated protein Cmr3 [Lysobacteraceae bacterium]|nr:MAG: CRISPR-associated protein Cmr3 [Xanthomonadaceae bacterium]